MSDYERIVARLMTFGGFQRSETGQFWVSRDDVIRLLDEELPGPIHPDDRPRAGKPNADDVARAEQVLKEKGWE